MGNLLLVLMTLGLFALIYFLCRHFLKVLDDNKTAGQKTRRSKTHYMSGGYHEEGSGGEINKNSTKE